MGTKVRLNSIYANAKGVAQPGDVIEVDSAEAKGLIDGGYASAVAVPAAAPRKSAKAAKIEAAEIELAEAQGELATAEGKLAAAADADKAAAQAEVDALREKVSAAEAALEKFGK